MDSQADSEAMVDAHVSKEHTFWADCHLCGKQVPSSDSVEMAELLVQSHIRLDHHTAECPYCGQTAQALDMIDARSEIANHIVHEHPGIEYRA